MIYIISGYWKDDNQPFENYLVTEWDCVPEGYVDYDFFYFGLSEKDLKESSIDDALEFVVTSYHKIED